jgi:hypothetical protein
MRESTSCLRKINRRGAACSASHFAWREAEISRTEELTRYTLFHRKREASDHFGVNVLCLENFDAAQFRIRATDGARMTIEDPRANPDWPGPRRSA